MENVTFAKCVKCGREYPAAPDVTLCSCGGVLDIQYDYDWIRASLQKKPLQDRTDPSMWRYREFLPVLPETPAPPLRVGGSPLYDRPLLAARLGLKKLWIKDDGQNPTASLKDRASAMAVAKAFEAGAKTICCSSTGNAASSLAGNAAAAGLQTVIFVPKRAPKGKVAQLLVFGAQVILVDGSYEETFAVSAAAIRRHGWYNRNAAINPFLAEGKKTVALEIAQQLHFHAPDFVAVSVGDGCTIAGVYKGFYDLFSAKLIDKIPRLISVQAAGCCPINTALETGKPLEKSDENTLADSIAVGVPRNPDKAMRAVKSSDGICVNVTDDEIMQMQKLLGTTCGVFGEPAGVAGAAGLLKACDAGAIPKGATAVCIVTGNGLKDVANAVRFAGEPPVIPPDPDAFETVYQTIRKESCK